MIAGRLGGLDEALVSRDRRAIREKIGTEPKIVGSGSHQAKYLSQDFHAVATDRSGDRRV